MIRCFCSRSRCFADRLCDSSSRRVVRAQIKAGLEFCCCCFVERKLMNELEMIKSDDSREAVFSQVVFLKVISR